MCLLWDLLRKKRVLPDEAGELVETVAAAGEKADNAQFSAGSVSSAAAVDDRDAVAAEASPSSPPPSPSSEEVTSGEETPLIKETFTDKIAPLAREITTYILDHQDDAAQEDRWRTTMKRDMSKSFREQRAASEKNFHAQHEESDKQREAIDSRFDRLDRQCEEVQAVKAEVKAEVQKVEAEVQKVEAELQRQRDAIHEVHSKLDETIQLVRNLG